MAMSHGCDGFEFDVRCTSDRRTVICHDETYRRLRVRDSSYDQLAKKSPQAAQLTCLDDVLAAFAKRAFLDIEIKVEGIEADVLAAVAKHRPKAYLISSFLTRVIEEIKARDANVPSGFIFDTRSQLTGWERMPVEFVFPQRALASQDLIDAIHSAGKKVFVWTVNRKAEMLRLRDWGVDGIISDDTELLCRTLRS